MLPLIVKLESLTVLARRLACKRPRKINVNIVFITPVKIIKKTPGS